MATTVFDVLIRGLETSQRYIEDLSRKYMDDNDD
jgi:hypothetical protein